jgi:PAS domain S-box-containing protein
VGKMQRVTKNETIAKREAIEFKRIVEQSLSAHIVLFNNTIVFCNSAFKSLSGYSQKELYTMDSGVVPRLFSEGYLVLFKQLVQLCLDGGQIAYHPDIRLVKKDGAYGWIEMTVSPIAFKGKCAVHLSCIDRTERKRQVEAALDITRTHCNLLQSDKLLAVMFDMRGTVSFCNQTMLDCVGRRHNEIAGRNWFDFCVPDKDLKQQYLQALIHETVPLHKEYDIITAQGERRTLFLSSTLLRNPQGAVEGALSVGEDLTERRRTEKALRENQEKFASIIEYTKDGVLLVDEAGCVIAWNRGIETITGLKREEVLGKSLWDALYILTGDEQKSPERYRDSQRFYEDLLSDGVLKTHASTLTTIKRPDGVKKNVQLELFIIHTSRGHRIGAIFSDVTELDALQEALNQSKEQCRLLALSAARGRTEFLSSISYKLRSTINHIFGLSALLLSTVPLNKKQRECASAIQTSVESLLRVIDESVVR